MQKIYEQHEKAFSNVQAFVICRAFPCGNTQGANIDRLATIAFKFPKDGAGRLYAYIHWFGTEMVRGHANGYGYDKKSAACESAIGNINQAMISPEQSQDHFIAFQKALINIGGNTWNRALEDAGFIVLQAV